MSVHGPDAGTASITVSGGTAIVTTAGGMAGWVNDNALYIGIGLSLVSLFVGVVFKMLASRQVERHHRESLKAEAEQNAQSHKELRAELIGEIRKVNHESRKEVVDSRPKAKGTDRCQPRDESP